MKHLWLGVLAAVAITAQASEPPNEPSNEPPPFGLSGAVVAPEHAPQARRALDRQARSGAAQESELSVRAYVDSQERLAETFRRPIAERIAEKTRGDR